MEQVPADRPVIAGKTKFRVSKWTHVSLNDINMKISSVFSWEWLILLLSPVDRATIQSPRSYLVPSTSPPAAFDHSPEPGSRLHAPCQPVAEFTAAATPCYRASLCGWPATSGGADHTARQCPTARQLGARQQCASGDEVKSPPLAQITEVATVGILMLASTLTYHRLVKKKIESKSFS